MSVSVSVEVLGIKEALRELNSIDKEARKKITRDFKQITKPVEQTAKALRLRLQGGMPNPDAS